MRRERPRNRKGGGGECSSGWNRTGPRKEKNTPDLLTARERLIRPALGGGGPLSSEEGRHVLAGLREIDLIS